MDDTQQKQKMIICDQTKISDPNNAIIRQCESCKESVTMKPQQNAMWMHTPGVAVVCKPCAIAAGIITEKNAEKLSDPDKIAADN